MGGTGATLVTWWIGTDHPGAVAGLRVGAAAAVAVAFGKVWLIGRTFMELRAATRPLRRLFDGWVVVVGGALVVLVLV